MSYLTKKSPLFPLGDVPVFLLALFLNALGLVFVYSATAYSEDLSTAFLKQVLASILGIALYLFLQKWDFVSFCSRHCLMLALCSLLLLLLLIPFGNDGGTGNKSWIALAGTPFNLQVAELVKVSFLIILAKYFSLRQFHDEINSPKTPLLSALATLSLCALLYLISGDMGMVLLYLGIYAIVAFHSLVPLRWFFLALFLGLILFYFLFPHFPSYIRERFLVVLDHDLDPLGKGYQQLRSLLAIGSGGLSGLGYLSGIQSQNQSSSALPARHTDFIFSVVCEEWGFFGACLILLLLFALVIRCFYLGYREERPFFALIACGVGGIFALQSILNIAMCLFLAPVIGLTLPFLSYGGSSLLCSYLALGLIQKPRKNQISA